MIRMKYVITKDENRAQNERKTLICDKKKLILIRITALCKNTEIIGIFSISNSK